MKLTTKICIVGDFAVGKTSVVERFVNNHFSEKYLSTVGVKIDTKEIDLKSLNLSIKLIIWDVAGADEFGEKEFSYLRGAAGVVYVVDGTRESTLASVQKIKTQITQRYDDKPNVLLLNKKDLTDSWQFNDGTVQSLHDHFGVVYQTSAKTGVEVDLALTKLAELIVDRDFQSSK